MNVLVVAAHPDDEVLGVGGTVARHAAAGDRVDILVCAQGLTSRSPGVEAAAIKELRGDARRAAAALGAEAPRFLDFPDNAMDGVPLLEVVKAVEAVVRETAPAVVYTHHLGDLNVDHGIVARATLTACRPLPGHRLRAIYAFETPSSTEWAPPPMAPFLPTHFVDVSAQMATKTEALECYAGELRPFPHPRSVAAIESLARQRGSAAGVAAAEAFMVLRSFW